MEILLLIIVIYILYKIGNNSSKNKKKKSVTLASIFDKHDTYPIIEMQKSINVIYEYLSKNDVKNAKTSAEFFPDFIEKLLQDYNESRNDFSPDDVQEDRKAFNWYSKEISKLENDMKPLMKKYVSYTKSEDGHHPEELWELDLPKELPDSYY